MDENMELSGVCRLCLSKKDKTLSIFGDGNAGEDPLSLKIRACVNVEVSKGDDLPKQICYQCSCHINLWYYYKQDCQRSQRKLQSWHGQLSKGNESHSQIDEVIHIKQEPPDYTCESFPVTDLEELSNEASESVNNGVDGENNEEDEDDDEDDDDDEEIAGHSMNLIIMDATSLPTGNLTCQDNIGSTVIELQPEEEDLLRTVVEDGDENEVTVLQVGKESGDMDMMEEITLDEDSTHSSAVEEALEEDLESDPTSSAFSERKSVPVGCNVHLVRIKEEKNEWPLTNDKESDPSKLQNHSTPADPSKPSYKCPICPRTFVTNQRKNIHLAKGHKDRTGSGIPQPSAATTAQGNKSTSFRALPKINNALYNEETLTCKICDKVYPNLWRHLRRSHEDRKPFACTVCRRIFKTKRELTTHRLRTISKYCRLGRTVLTTEPSKMFTVNPKIPKNVIGRYVCRQCPSQFKCFSMVKNHFTIHTGEKPYQCPKCEKEFREYKAASTHFKICNAPLPHYKYAGPRVQPKPPGERVLRKCPNCPKQFMAAGSLWKHKKTCKKTQCCPNCSQNIAEDELEAHSMTCALSSEKGYNRKRVERTSLTLQDILDIHKTDGQSPQELRCKVCNNDFSSVKSLKAHIRKHSALPLRCYICDLTFKQESTLRSHMESYHGEVQQVTPTLKAKNALMAKHKARIIPFTSKLKCDQCHKLFSSMSALQFHKKTHKPGAPALTCLVCNKVFMSVNSLNQHKKIHASIQLKMKIYKCTFCDNSYSDAKDLQIHKLSVHHEEEMAAASNLAPNSSALVNNTEEESESPPKVIFKCDTCGKPFTSEISLARHKKLHEASQDINKFRCESCNKSFLSSKSFDSHKGWHTRSTSALPKLPSFHPKVKTTKFYCPVCGKAFLHKANAKRHMMTSSHGFKGPPTMTPPLNPVAQNPKPEYKCKSCVIVCPDLKSYKQHIQSHKSNTGGGTSTNDTSEEGPLVCKLCKKTLRSLKGYKKHLLGHSNQKPFKCDVCSNQYNSETLLTKHKLAHEFKAFACNKCKAYFSEKDELIAHYESCSV